MNTLRNGTNEIKINKTRYKGFGYANLNPVGSAVWRVIDLHDGRPRPVGENYATKVELLADFDRYAKTWGY